MQALVTGGAGFIGSHLCEALLRRGDDVVVLDNFDPFYDRSLKEENISIIQAAAQASGRRLVVIEGDICFAADLDSAFGAGKIDVVIHLAALAGVRPSIAQPLRYQEVNVGGTAQVLEAMRRHGVRKMVFASSSSVYGNSNTPPFREDACVDYPISPYAATKKAGELLCHTYHHLFAFDIFCLRYFTVYGPRQRPDLAIHKFARILWERGKIPMYGKGDTQRDYTYIDDILQGTMASIDRVRGFRVYNLGGNRTIALRDLIAQLGNAMGLEPRLETLPPQPGDVDLTHADISRAAADLGYAPQTPLEMGLAKFAAWFRSRYGQPSPSANR